MHIFVYKAHRSEVLQTKLDHLWLFGMCQSLLQAFLQFKHSLCVAKEQNLQPLL